MLAKCGRNLLSSSLSHRAGHSRRSITFELTEFQREFQQASRKFAREVVAPQAAKWDQANVYPADVHRQAWEQGFYSIGIPEKFGGLGQGLQEICLVNEELSYGCTGFTTTLFVNELALAPLHMHGSPQLQEKYFTRNVTQPIVSAYAVTEPNTGSDVAGVRTNARLQPDGSWLLNGSKMWISNGGVANW